MNKFLFIPISLIAVVLGFYWFKSNSVVENRVVDQAEFSAAPKLDNSPVEVIPVSRGPAELNQLQGAHSEEIDSSTGIGINTPGSFIDVDYYPYQRADIESINVGEVKEANDTSYQWDDREVINVGEFMDVEILDSTY